MSALSELSAEEKLQIEKDRYQAIRDALARERELVEQGKGTRQWTKAQQEDILAGNRPRDENGVAIEAHHKASVSEYPEQAGNPDNIQWLTEDEHLNGAHNGNTHTPTNGYYDPLTGETTLFEGAPTPTPVIDLEEPIALAQEAAQSVELLEMQAETAKKMIETVTEVIVIA